MAIKLTTAVLVSMGTESILFGLLTALFFTSAHILIFRRRRGQPLNRIILAVSVVMYALAFTHLVVAIHRILSGFIGSADEPGGPNAYFAFLARPSSILKETAYVAATLVGDSFVIYRLYIVWSREIRLLVPALVLLSGDIASGIGAISELPKAGAHGVPIFNPHQKPWNISFFTLSLVTNFSCTFLIAYKIWSTDRNTSAVMRTRTLSPIAVIVIESGAMYSISLTALFADYLAGNFSQYIIVDAIPQIIGIAFTLIIVRIGMGSSVNDTTFRSTGNTSNRVPMKPLAVHLSRSKYAEDDEGMRVEGADMVGASSTASMGDKRDEALGSEAASIV